MVTANLSGRPDKVKAHDKKPHEITMKK